MYERELIIGGFRDADSEMEICMQEACWVSSRDQHLQGRKGQDVKLRPIKTEASVVELTGALGLG